MATQSTKHGGTIALGVAIVVMSIANVWCPFIASHQYMVVVIDPYLTVPDAFVYRNTEEQSTSEAAIRINW